MNLMKPSKKAAGVLLAVLLATTAAACGDDDTEPTADDASTTEENEATEEEGEEGEDGGEEAAGIDPEFAEYCEISRTLDEQEGFPTVEQLEAIKAAAPEEIAEQITFVADAFIAGIEAGDPAAAFDDPAVEEAFSVIEAFDAEHCGIEQDEEEPEQDPSVTQLDPAAARVDVIATEYALDVPETLPAGRTSFVLINQGEERHVLNVFQIAEGFTFEEILASDGNEGLVEDWDFYSDTAAPGEEAYLTVDLVPGNYGYICYLPTPEGESHIDLGMVGSFTVS